MISEKFFPLIWLRFKQLVDKFLSVKGVFTIQVSAGFFFFGHPVPVWLFATAWVLFIGGRYVDKFIEMYKNLIPTGFPAGKGQ